MDRPSFCVAPLRYFCGLAFFNISVSSSSINALTLILRSHAISRSCSYTPGANDTLRGILMRSCGGRFFLVIVVGAEPGCQGYPRRCPGSTPILNNLAGSC